MATATTTATPATTGAERWTALFWSVTLAGALPVFATRWLPFTDLPEHVASMATIARLASEPAGEALPYVLDVTRSQYILHHLVGGLATLVIGDAVRANQVLLALLAVAWPLSLRSLLRAMGGDERIAVFGPLVFWNRALLMGFLPFVASVPLALFALASVARARAPSLRGAPGLAVLAIALFYTHVSMWLLFVAIAAALAAFGAVDRTPFDGPRSAARIASRALVGCWPILFSAVCAIVWWRTGSLAGGRAVPAPEDIGHMRLGRAMNALPAWTFDMWRSHVDELCAVLWWSGFALCLTLGRSRGARLGPWRRLHLLVPFLGAAALYVLTPFRVGAASMLNVRLAPVVTLFALLPLRLPAGRKGLAPILLATAAALTADVNAATEMRRTSRAVLGDDFDGLLARMDPSARLVTLSFDQRVPGMHYWSYLFAGSYHRSRGGAVASWSFSELPHWPVHYAAGLAPPEHFPFWLFQPCDFRHGRDGRYYDYVLLRGDAPAALFEAHEGVQFLPVARSGVMTLLQRSAAPAERAGSPDDPRLCDR